MLSPSSPVNQNEALTNLTAGVPTLANHISEVADIGKGKGKDEEIKDELSDRARSPSIPLHKRRPSSSSRGNFAAFFPAKANHDYKGVRAKPTPDIQQTSYDACLKLIELLVADVHNPYSQEHLYITLDFLSDTAQYLKKYVSLKDPTFSNDTPVEAHHASSIRSRRV